MSSPRTHDPFDHNIIYIEDDNLFYDKNPKNSQFILSVPNKSAIFKNKANRFNREKLKITLQIIGIKYNNANKIAEQIYYEAISSVNEKELSKTNDNNKNKVITTSQTYFNSLLHEKLGTTKPKITTFIKNFNLACNIVVIIVMLGGPSGTGKSSISSLLASRLGLPSVLSTDSIRHILRNFLSKEENQILFASTYEAGQYVQITENMSEKELEKKKTLFGFYKQCQYVQNRLEEVIDFQIQKSESIVIEGVHLTPDFMLKIWKKYKNACLPFCVYISNEKKHKERFAVRSKYMTLEAKYNKYIENFKNIRIIQKDLIKKADQLLIPKIDNSNIDKSMGLIHKTIIRFLRKIYIKHENVNFENNNALEIYQEFNKATNNIWSTSVVRKYISAKVNKAELYQKFIEDLQNNPPEKIKNDEENEKINKCDKKNNVEINEINEINENNNKNYDEKNDKLNENFEKIDNYEKNKKTNITEEKTNFHEENIIKNVEIQKKTENNEVLIDLYDIKFNKINSNFEEKTLEEKKKENLNKIHLDNIEEYVEKLDSISLKKELPVTSIKKLRQKIKEINKKLNFQRVFLVKTNKRYLIFKAKSIHYRTVSAGNKSQEKIVNHTDIRSGEASPLEDKLKKNSKISIRNYVKNYLYKNEVLIHGKRSVKKRNSVKNAFSSEDSSGLISSCSEIEEKHSELESNISGSMDVNLQNRSLGPMDFSDRDSLKIEEDEEFELNESQEEPVNSIESSENNENNNIESELSDERETSIK